MAEESQMEDHCFKVAALFQVKVIIACFNCVCVLLLFGVCHYYADHVAQGSLFVANGDERYFGLLCVCNKISIFLYSI